MKREQSARNLFLPYKQFGIDIFKKENNTPYSTFNEKNNNFRLRTPLSSYGLRSNPKKEALFDVEKKLKKMTLSNKAFFNYMNKYTKLTQNFTFKTPNISIYPKKKNPKYLPISYLEKFGNNSLKEENVKDNEKINNEDYVNFNVLNLNNEEQNIFKNDDEYNDNEEDNMIKEKPYGFKYKDTRIIYDKSKLRVKSSLYKSNSEFNLTNIRPNINYKKRTNFNFHMNKEE